MSVLFSPVLFFYPRGKNTGCLAPWKPKITKFLKNVVQNKVFEKSISNCYSGRGFKYGFWAPTRKSVFWPTFLGVPGWNMVLGPGPARPAGPGFAHSGTSQGKCFLLPGQERAKKPLIKIILFSGIWRLAGQPLRAGQGLPGLKCFLLPGQEKCFFLSGQRKTY